MKTILRYVALPLLMCAAVIVAVKTVWGYSPVAVVSTFAVLLIVVIVKGFSLRRSDVQRGWRVGHQGRDQMFYEEIVAGRWERIEIDGEMLCGDAHHVIYFPTIQKWEALPEWSRGRRSEIVARIKMVFTPPGYEYEEAEQDAPFNGG